MALDTAAMPVAPGVKGPFEPPIRLDCKPWEAVIKVLSSAAVEDAAESFVDSGFVGCLRTSVETHVSIGMNQNLICE